MIKVEPSVELFEPVELSQADVLRKLEQAGRVCYKSAPKGTPESAETFVRKLIKHGHESVLEHVNLTLKFTTDRGITHELVRHRLASYSQESSRYCDYTGQGITVIEPSGLVTDEQRLVWELAMEAADTAYAKLRNLGLSPQVARSVLPTCAKTEIVVTMNIRQWRHVLDVRWIGATGKPHPDMVLLMDKVAKLLKDKYPVLFEDKEIK